MFYVLCTMNLRLKFGCYYSQVAKRDCFWSLMIEIISAFDGPWLLVGVYNSITSCENLEKEESLALE